MNPPMVLLANLAVVLVGIYLSMRCVAALHRVVDLGYAWQREKWRIARGLLGWGGGSLLLYVMLPDAWQGLFAISLLAYALSYVLLWSLIRVLLAQYWRRFRHGVSALDDGGHAHPARGTDGNQPPT